MAGDEEEEVAADCAMDSVDSDRVLSSVNGVNANPTAVRAVLPTSKSPIGVSLTLPPPPPVDAVDAVEGEGFARKKEDRPTRARRRERERK